MNKLGLGTVQFGCDYGISNSNGQVNLYEIEKILNFAVENDIDTIDTASLYGNAESVLGNFDLSDFKIITKTVKVNDNLSKDDNLNQFNQSFYNSLIKLRQNSIYGMLFHNCDDLEGKFGDDLWEFAAGLKQRNLVQKIGISVYNPSQVINIINKYDIDIVQLPLNMLDQRFLEYIPILKHKNIEIHSRSTFLQGLLLMDTNNLNAYFNDIKNVLEKIKKPKLAYALNFVKKIEGIDKIIVGCTSALELQEIFMMYNKNVNLTDYSIFKIEDEKIINPSKWVYERR